MVSHAQLRCLIAAGGTAGHVLPALAVAEALRSRGVSVTFAGSPDRAEARLVPEAGFELDAFRVTGFPREPSLRLARALALAGRAPQACRAILERRQPHVVLGGGGFVAGPMVLAAWTKRIPAAITEADAHLGLANRLAAPFARRIFLAYPLATRTDSKYRVVGRPIPQRSQPMAKDAARRLFGLPADRPVLVVFGALAGARSINELAVEAFGEAGPPVLHLSGERDYPSLAGRVQRDDYKLLPFTDHFGAALSAADLVVSRAGGSVWEIAAAGKPAILVPYPFATADHQTKNADYFQRAGGAVRVPEIDLEDVPDLVRSLLGDPRRLAQMGRAMKAAARPGAADEIAAGLVELATSR
jgi:UDP-N-acetylglucosamine--N-acetylmuramyl-(pentapeptide) pyrophosphoryl-undecaprenol N-acetylglucosamine transferase